MQVPTIALPWLLSIHRAAEATPYYDIDGYMKRNWVLGARSPDRNDDNPQWDGRSGGKLYNAFTRQVAIRAHEVLRSDNDRHLHDHPCASLSIVLEGGYWEVTRHPVSEQQLPLVRQKILGRIALLDHCEPDKDLVKAARSIGVYWRGPGAVVFRTAKTWHRLILPRGTTTKSLFVLGPKSQDWGFLTPSGKVPRRQYLARYNEMLGRTDPKTFTHAANQEAGGAVLV